MQSTLQAARSLSGPTPRRIPLNERPYFYPPAPGWITRDELKRVYKDRGRLLREGRVVLGALIQANRALYQPGNDDLPAAALWSDDPYFEEQPARLLELARQVGALKGTSPGGEMAEVARFITNETLRLLGYKMPDSFGEGHALWLTTPMVFRRHLPCGYITTRLLPMLVQPELSPVALILPGKFWPDEWKDR